MATLPSRRGLLRAGAVGGGSAVLAIAGQSGSALAAPGGAGGAAAGLPPFALFAQQDLNFETLFTLGAAGYGAAEVGEVITAVNEVNASGATYQAIFDVFGRLAERLSKLADGQLAAGHKISARSAYLRAASYYDVCLFFVLGTRAHAREASVYARMQHNWARAAQLFDPPFERVRIPYAGTWLPGYFLRPPGGRIARPTVILNNGSDAQNIDLYVYGGAAALERGYNALIFEGPGQGSMLFEREIPFRPDWQHVVIPIVNWLSARPDVDSKRIAITGWSLCGESVIQAAAFEHRLAAVVADPGVLDPWKAWPEPIQKLMASGASKAEVNHVWKTDYLTRTNAIQRFQLAKRAELFGRRYLLAARAGRVYTDLYDLAKTIMRINCESAAPLVTSPVLVTEYQDDNFFGHHQQAGQVFRLLPSGTRKRMHFFTAAEGAEYHDAPMAPQTRNQVVFDWLDDVL